MSSQITREEYLDKNFDYTKLTKQELRQIMSENNIQEIPPLTSLKSVIMDAYKTSIHDRIERLRRNFSQENIFQASASNDESSRAGDSMNSAIESGLANETRSRRPAEGGNRSFTDTPRRRSKGLPGSQSLKESNEEGQGGKPCAGARSSSPKRGRAVRLGNERPNESFNDSFVSMHSSRVGSSFNTTMDPSESMQGSATAPESPKEGSAVASERPVLTSPHKPGSEKAQRPHRALKKRYLFYALLASLSVYLKFFCPYCTPGDRRLCVPLPVHSYLRDGQLHCAKGYRIVRGIVTHCVADDSEYIKNMKKMGRIVQMLEYAKGEHRYNARSAYKLRLAHLTSDEDVIGLLRGSGRLSFAGDFVEAKHGRVAFRVFARFYLLKTVKILIPLVLGILLIKMYINRRRRRALMMKQAGTIAKDVLDILSRQFVASTKSAVFKTYVYEVQLRDALDVKGTLWDCVRQIVQQNSNVECKTDGAGRAVWEWVGPILSAGDGHNFK